MLNHLKLLNNLDKNSSHLFFNDFTHLILDKKSIREMADFYWNNKNKISSEIKNALEFRPCKICDSYGKTVMCKAIQPVLPVLEIVDRFMSYEEVFVFYRDRNGLNYSTKISLQHALYFVAFISLFDFCSVLKKYKKYFKQVLPFMSDTEIVYKIFLNISYLNNCENEEINEVIKNLKTDVQITTGNQLKRLRLLCKKDAFLNAYFETMIIFQRLTFNIKEKVEKLFTDDYELLA